MNAAKFYRFALMGLAAAVLAACGTKKTVPPTTMPGPPVTPGAPLPAGTPLPLGHSIAPGGTGMVVGGTVFWCRRRPARRRPAPSGQNGKIWQHSYGCLEAV